MKAYVRSYKEIKKNGRMCNGYIYVEGHYSGPAFVHGMKEFCEKGPFEFRALEYESGEWLRGLSFNWHISWLNPYPKNGQYLLEF